MTGLDDLLGPQELLAAVREFLAEDGAAALTGRARFHLRVAMNLIDIVVRQLQSGPAQEAAHRERLAELGFCDDAALSAAIRSGALDDRYDEVAEAVRLDVWDRVAVVNPRYREPYPSSLTARESLFGDQP